MSVSIQWLGHASFRLAGGESVVYIDPWKLADPAPDADVVFVSHSHHDHCSPDDVQAVSNDRTVVVAPADTIEALHATNAITPGEGWTIRDVTVEAVAAYNVGKRFHPRDNNWLGALLTLADRRVYYAGDTDLIPEMSDLADVDVALLPVGGTYTLTAREAVDACRAVAPRLAIPYHWGDIVGERSDAERFAADAPCQVKILQPGETITIE